MSNQVSSRNAIRSGIPIPAIIICSIVAIFLLIALVGGKNSKSKTNSDSAIATSEVIATNNISPNNSNSGTSSVGVTETVYTPSYTEISVPALLVNTMSIEGLPSNPTAVDAATIVTYSGAVSSDDQVDEYSFVAPYDGWYRADISELQSGVNVELFIVDDSGYTVSSDTYCVNGEGTTADNLIAGHTYVVRVKQDSGYSGYNLSIGMQKPTVDITGYSTVSDSIEFTDQRNIYTFTAPIDGRYRFELSGVQSDTNFELYMYNYLGETLESDTYCLNGEGITVKDLKGGETYQVQIRQDSGFSSYSLFIGYQKTTVDISELSSLTDSIEYTGQRNVYTFTAPIEGRYRFEISGMQNGTDFELYLFNDLGETVESNTYCINGEGITAKGLEAGKVYELQIRQDSGLSGYTLTIGKQKESVEVSRNCIVNDSIEFTDQRNVYALSAGTSGQIQITISGLNSNTAIELYVFDDLHNEVDSDSYCTNGESLTVSNLSSGTQYWIQIRQYDGGGSYTMLIE